MNKLNKPKFMFPNTKNVELKKLSELKKSQMLKSHKEQLINNYKSVNLKSQSQEHQEDNQYPN